MEDLVLLERRPNGVAVVTLNNPKVNALSQAMLARIKEIALDLTANPPGAVVITGGERILRPEPTSANSAEPLKAIASDSDFIVHSTPSLPFHVL